MEQKKFQERVDFFLTHSEEGWGVFFEAFITFLVLVICAIFVISTYSIHPKLRELLSLIETGITFIFLMEYLLRWWAKRFSIAYLFSLQSLVDILAIFPLFIPESRWQFVRVLRISRILRLMRFLQKKQTPFGEFTEIHLRGIRILFTLFCIVFISSGLIYDVESHYNPVGFSTFFDGVYFSIVTLTTVGFGDLTPMSWQGKTVTLLMITSGMVLIPWQLGGLARCILLATAKQEIACKHCGLSYHDPDASHCKACGNIIFQEKL